MGYVPKLQKYPAKYINSHVHSNIEKLHENHINNKLEIQNVMDMFWKHLNNAIYNQKLILKVYSKSEIINFMFK